jgi:hypothetical protein
MWYATITGALLIVYIGLMAYTLWFGASWFPDPLHYAFVSLLCLAVLCSVVAECARWVNERADLRAVAAVKRAKWINDQAEARHGREPAWSKERTQPQRVVWSTVVRPNPLPRSRMRDTNEWVPNYSPSAEDLDKMLDPPTGDIN